MPPARVSSVPKNSSPRNYRRIFGIPNFPGLRVEARNLKYTIKVVLLRAFRTNCEMQALSLKARWILAITVVVVPIVFFGAPVFKGLSRPNDRDLVAQFQKQKGQFQELVGIFKAHDKVRSIENSGVTSEPYRNATLAEVGLSAANYARSIQLLKECGSAVAIRDEEEIRFAVAGFGWASKGYRIAITYRTSEPTPKIANLDDFRKSKSEWEQAYRKIEDNWYLWIIW